MKKNSFLDRQRKNEDAFFHAGVECGAQIMSDAWQVILNDPDIMGKSVIGKGRMKEICTAAHKFSNELMDALDIRNPEADVLQEKLDAKLSKLYLDDFVPFSERYPMIKKCKY